MRWGTDYNSEGKLYFCCFLIDLIKTHIDMNPSTGCCPWCALLNLSSSQMFFSFPGGSVVKESTCQCKRYRGHGFDPWVGRTPGVGNGNPPQYSCSEDSMDRSLEGYSPCSRKELDRTEHAHTLKPWISSMSAQCPMFKTPTDLLSVENWGRNVR